MKELTIEQKAEAYEKALERAQEALKDGTINSITIAYLQNIFPELKKESEDERIRKEICKILWDNVPYEEAQEYINYICRKQASTNSKEYEEMKETCIFYLNRQKCYVNDVPCIEKCIAWLEKQNSNVDNANKEYWRGYREGKQEILDKFAEFEKQGEQKPAEWSKDDERSVRDSIFYLKSAKKYFEKDDDILWDEKWFNLCVERLQSLHKRLQPQQQWKPSEEQIKALDIAIRCGIQLGTWQEDALKSLKEQLFKLKKLSEG